MSADNWSAEYGARKGDVDLRIYRRCKEAPSRGRNPPVLFLVHGSSFGALAGYDLHVAGKQGYSMMDVCAAQVATAAGTSPLLKPSMNWFTTATTAFCSAVCWAATPGAWVIRASARTVSVFVIRSLRVGVSE